MENNTVCEKNEFQKGNRPMTAFEVAQKIDISAVRTQHTLRDIEEIVRWA